MHRIADQVTGSTDWQAERRAAAQAQGDALAKRRATEAAKAQHIIDEFVTTAKEQALPVQPLRAKSYSSGASYRTNLVGWYIKKDRSLAVSDDGAYLVLRVPGEPLGRLRGVRVSPSEPPLVVGAGGRDGESIALAELLARRLAEPNGY